MGLGDDFRTLALYEFEVYRRARKAKSTRKITGTGGCCGELGTDLVIDIGSHSAANAALLAEYLNRKPNLGPYRSRRRK
jgi:hypothetical protein